MSSATPDGATYGTEAGTAGGAVASSAAGTSMAADGDEATGGGVGTGDGRATAGGSSAGDCAGACGDPEVACFEARQLLLEHDHHVAIMSGLPPEWEEQHVRVMFVRMGGCSHVRFWRAPGGEGRICLVQLRHGQAIGPVLQLLGNTQLDLRFTAGLRAEASHGAGAAEDQPAVEETHPLHGARVRLHGQRCQEWANGLEGTVVDFDADAGRLGVLLDGMGPDDMIQVLAKDLIVLAEDIGAAPVQEAEGEREAEEAEEEKEAKVPLEEVASDTRPPGSAVRSVKRSRGGSQGSQDSASSANHPPQPTRRPRAPDSNSSERERNTTTSPKSP
uniref:Uncharacterized protein n=2 Tax=Alexandrium monilatum TaxID=311494 RepID=A0A7S4VYG7_9DINO|mmetsp:Transcript_7463/g.23566  ORF Transcript_7463/g.23566 Transcript_7463/m.23566 type:complete len:332 (+) Transcript_7463:120-1115(+)